MRSCEVSVARIELGAPLGYSKRPVPALLLEDLPPQERAGLRIVAVTMTAEERRKVRRRLTLAADLEIGLALPTGTVLDPGTVLFRDGGRAFVVEAAAEEVLVIAPRTAEEGVRVAHLLGNLHRDIDTASGDIAILYEAAIELLLRRRGYHVARARRPFLGRPTGSEAHRVRG